MDHDYGSDAAPWGMPATGGQADGWSSLSSFAGEPYPPEDVKRSVIGGMSLGSADDAFSAGDPYRFAGGIQRGGIFSQGDGGFASKLGSGFGDMTADDPFGMYPAKPGLLQPQQQRQQDQSLFQQHSQAAESFQLSDEPPPLPTDSFFRLAETTLLLCSFMPYQLGNVLVAFLAGQMHAMSMKVKPHKYSIKGEVCHKQAAVCVKIRVYTTADHKIAVELQNRSGDPLAFMSIFTLLKEYLRANIDPTVENYHVEGSLGDFGSGFSFEPPPLPAFDFGDNALELPPPPPMLELEAYDDFLPPPPPPPPPFGAAVPMQREDVEPLIGLAADTDKLPETVQAEVASSLHCVAQEPQSARLLCTEQGMKALGQLQQRATCEEAVRYANDALGLLASHQETQQLFGAHSGLQLLIQGLSGQEQMATLGMGDFQEPDLLLGLSPQDKKEEHRAPAELQRLAKVIATFSTQCAWHLPKEIAVDCFHRLEVVMQRSFLYGWDFETVSHLNKAHAVLNSRALGQ